MDPQQTQDPSDLLRGCMTRAVAAMLVRRQRTAVELFE